MNRLLRIHPGIRKLAGQITGAALGVVLAAASFPASAQVHIEGEWGPLLSWPHVPVSAANLPDGRILTWASNERDDFPGNRPEFTFTGVFDPVTGLVTEIDHDGHDMFCAHQVMLEDGQVFVSGGRNSEDSPFTTIFDFRSDTWIPLNSMNRGRWYPTSLVLATGEVYTAIGRGGQNTSETYDPETGDWQLETNINYNNVVLQYPSSQYREREWWPLFNLAPDGRIFHSGPTPQMHWIDTAGLGSATAVGSEFTDWYTKHGTTVMYDEGKLLTAGGWIEGNDIRSTGRSMTIDISSATPVVTEIAPMLSPRKFHNGVMLPNGEVFVVGGNLNGRKFNDDDAVRSTEIWNPTTGLWRQTASISSATARTYHSIALLMTDGRVLSAGGGLCSCSADHPDGQIYSPPYLFNTDGTPATRPVITSAPSSVRPADTFEVTTDSNVDRFTLVRMSSTTHGVNTDLRFLEVTPTLVGGTTYSLTVSSNPNVLLPGYWMLFALNAQGTPSVSHVLQVRSESSGNPVQPALDVAYSSMADLSAFNLNGSAQGFGGSLRLASGSDEAGSGFFNTPVSVDSDTSFATNFAFRIGGTPGGNGGMAFLVQGNDNDALGAEDGGLGYQTVLNSLVVEVDITDDGAGDPDANHIAVHSQGDPANPLATATPGFDLDDGAEHRIWIEYDGLTDSLDVYIAEDTLAAKPATPIISLASIDLPALVGTRAFFGFSAGTGSAANDHDVNDFALAAGSGLSTVIVNPIVATPQPIDQSVQYTADATGSGLQYRWSFGDGSPQLPWDTNPTVIHDYSAAGPGRYFVTLEVKDTFGNVETINYVQAMHPPIAPGTPLASNSLLVESATGSERIWMANPDNDSVTVFRAADNSKLAEITVGDEPRTLALGPGGLIWVVNKLSDSISKIDVNTLSVSSVQQLPSGSNPHAVIIDDGSNSAFVSLETTGFIAKFDATTGVEQATLEVGSYVRHLSMTPDRNDLYATQFITPPLVGESTTTPAGTDGAQVHQIDPATMSVLGTTTLGFSYNQPQEQTGPGVPNYLGPALITPSGLEAFVPSKQDNILRGSQRNGFHLTFDQTVRAVTSVFNLASGTEDLGRRVDQDNASVSSNGVFGGGGSYLFVALEGNEEVSVVDAVSSVELFRIQVGLAPQAVALSSDGYTLYVRNFLDRSLSVVDLTDLINGAADSASVTATLVSVDPANEALLPDVKLGKEFFYNARDPRLAAQSYLSCASCHADGGHDGRVWDFKGFGEGLRNTIGLMGHAGTGQGRLHWTANFDEVHDFENQIRDFSLGAGLMTGPDFAATEDTLGPPKSGLSADLDALSAYVSSLDSFGRSPYRDSSGSLSPAGEAGRLVFEAADCASCHSGEGFTDSALGTELLHDVGTLKVSSGERMGLPLAGLDTPTLKGLWTTGPYLHDGSAMTIREAVEAHDASAFNGLTLSSQELDDLAAYLAQIDDYEFQGAGGPGAFQQDASGEVVFEAENFSANNGDAGIGAWQPITNGEASDGSALQAAPGGVTVAPLAPVAEYPVNITSPGDHWVWFRFRAFDTSSDSIFMQIDDLRLKSRTLIPADGNWQWMALGPRYSLDAGQHTVKLYRREGGAQVDKIIVTNDPAYPVPVGAGPPESVWASSGGGSSNNAPDLNAIADENLVEGASGTVNLSATDGDGDNLFFSESGLPSFATLNDNGDGTATIDLNPLPGDAGAYAVTVFVDDDGSPSLGDAEEFTIMVTPAGGSAVYQQGVDGSVVVEAENFSLNLGDGGVGIWNVVADASASGTTAIEAGVGAVTTAPVAPVTEYLINITSPGDHWVWFRFKAFDSGTDSLFMQIDDLNLKSRSLNPVTGDWQWMALGPRYNLDAGQHTVRLYRREGGVQVDKIVVTNDPAYPVPTGTGPSESDFIAGGGGSNTAPDLNAIVDESLVEGASATVNLSAMDDDGDNLFYSESGLPSFATLNDNGDGTATIDLNPLPGDAGAYAVEIFVDDDGTPSLGDVEQFTIIVTPVGGPAVYQQGVDGAVVVEAESFASNTGDGGVGAWNVVGDAGASGTTAIEAGVGAVTTAPVAPVTEYLINITSPGDHWVWFRFKAFDGGTDSLFMQIDDLKLKSRSLSPVNGSWQWMALGPRYALGVGQHTVKLYRREGAVQVDKIIVTNDPAFPLPTGVGPPQSPQL